MVITLPVQTRESLVQAHSYLKRFDRCKDVFMNAGCNLNLPKIHSLRHYTERIISFGTPDNFDTEYTEHQHITDAKDPYRKTNKVNPVPQMVKYVERRTALQLKYQYLNSLLISEEVGDNIVRTGHQPSIGSRMPGCPIHISSVKRLF